MAPVPPRRPLTAPDCGSERCPHLDDVMELRESMGGVAAELKHLATSIGRIFDRLDLLQENHTAWKARSQLMLSIGGVLGSLITVLISVALSPSGPAIWKAMGHFFGAP